MIKKDDLILDSPRKSGMTIQELCSLCELCKTFGPMKVLEIGTKHGRTTINIARHTPPGAAICSLDIEYLKKPEIEEFPEYEKIRWLKGDSRTFDYETWGLVNFDMILIDGGHDIETVKADTNKARGLARASGCLFVWHDYGKDAPDNNLRVTAALDALGYSPTQIEDTSLAYAWLEVV